jgi:DNA-binding SARP family transcriptional activator
MVRFGILGPLEVQTPDGRSPVLTAMKPRILLGVLLLYANQPVGNTTLIDALWPRRAPRTAEGALRTHVWTLRRSLRLTGLSARPRGYQLDVDAPDLDVLLFDRLTEDGHRAAGRGDPVGAVESWQRALSLWRGRPLDGVDVGAAAESTLADLAERRFALLEQWAQVSLMLGQQAEVLPVLAAAAVEQPLRERLHELTMLALYRTGRQADALEAFRRLRRRLVAELGVEPGPALQLLQRQILSADPALDASPPRLTAVTVDASPVPQQLPPDVRVFTGRHRELELADAQLTAGSPLRAPPVVAISGAAGVGKSTLAVRLAHRLARRFPDGQLYIDLQGAAAGLRPLPPLEALGRFLRALGTRSKGASTVDEASAAFRAAVVDRRVLVVLDNAASVEQVRPLLPTGARTAVLVTSRPMLSTLDNSVQLPLDVLTHTEAVQLLSRLVGADRIATDPAAAQRLALWCGHLPLALRIAGARLLARPAWPVRELVDRLSDARHRLAELRVDELDVRSSLQVGYELLREGDDDDQAAAMAFPLIALSDATDLSRPAAAALLDLDEPAAGLILDRLVDRAFLTTPAPGRYRLHDLLRLYGRSLVDGSDSGAMTRLVRWYAATTWQAFRLLRPADPRPASAGRWAVGGRPFPDVVAALEWLDAERPNLLAAVQQVAESPQLPADAATSLARALFAYFHVRGHLRDWVEVNQTARALARGMGDPIAEAHACRDLGAAFEVRGEYGAALSCLRDALDRYTAAGDRAGVAVCLNSLGAVHDSLGQLDEAAVCLERSLAVSRELADPHTEGISLNNLGQVYCGLGDHRRARDCLRAALAIFQRTGNRRSQAAALSNLARVYEREKSYVRALSRYQQSHTMFVELDFQVGQAEVLTSMGRVHRLLGHHALSLSLLCQALEVAQRVDERRSTAISLWELGMTRDALGEQDASRDSWARALAIFEQIGVPEADEVRALLKGEHGSLVDA